MIFIYRFTNIVPISSIRTKSCIYYVLCVYNLEAMAKKENRYNCFTLFVDNLLKISKVPVHVLTKIPEILIE